MNETEIQTLFAAGARVANIGVGDFAADIESQKAPVVQIRWAPPVELDEDLQSLLDDLL